MRCNRECVRPITIQKPVLRARRGKPDRNFKCPFDLNVIFEVAFTTPV
ncbi:hypothetical protein EYZ11_011393 [Aspergillus tanneri]|uniref:Uncharacterized protein n=1 Tax=Aspergillus tanneri TaxID=1220188 RepID=A0A4S3J3J6_9EURO|nr:hypothetical protein EYZ11_011393 [Aspergillus tanneri]